MASCNSPDILDTSSDEDVDIATPIEDDSHRGSNVGYMQIVRDILSKLKNEIDSQAVDDLQRVCQQLSMDVDLKTELISARKWDDVLQVLLKHSHDDLGLVIQILNEFVPTVIADLDPEVKSKMQWHWDTISKANSFFGLDTKVLYGRKTELKKLTDYMDFEKDKDVRLVNVCGMPGIGKSFLIKHFGARLLMEGHSVVIYVDASGLNHLSDLMVALLNNANVDAYAGGNTADLMAKFYSSLKQQRKEKFVLIIDDYSTLMPQSDKDQINQSLSFLAELVNRTHAMKIQIKILVTSQTPLTITNTERNEVNALRSIKLQMADYTRDIYINSLNNKEAESFLGQSLHSSNQQQKDKLLKLCDGHPYLLQLIGSAANLDYTPTTEVTNLNDDDVDDVIKLVDINFQKAFGKLTESQQLVLLAVTLFDRDAQLGALHSIMGYGGSRLRFSQEIKREFFNLFWLTFRVCNIKDEAEKYTVVNTHHPLVMKFLKRKMSEYFENTSSKYHSQCVEFKRRYVIYFVTEMATIGAGCVGSKVYKDRPSNPNFLPRLCSKFLGSRTHIRCAFNYILQCNEPQLLFSAVDQVKPLRESSDICHLFVCLHQYHDFFDGFLVNALTELVHRNISDPNHGVLIWALYVMILTVEQEWRMLDNILKNRMEMADPQLLRATSPDLFSLCKAIYGYASGALHIYASWLKDRADPAVVNKRSDALGGSLKNLNLENLSPDTNGVRRYFSIHVLLLQAEATFLANKTSLGTVREGYALCKEAKRIISNTQDSDIRTEILMPLVYSKLALFRARDGNIDEAGRKAKYQEAHFFFDKVDRELISRGMKDSAMAAHNLLDHSTVMRSFAISSSQIGSKTDALNYLLRHSIPYSEKAAHILELLSAKNKLDLFRSYVDIANNWEISQSLTSKSDSYQRVKCQTKAFKYYRKAYNVILRDYWSCHLSATDRRLKLLQERLPHMMEKHGLRMESVDKVCATLQKVQDLAWRETDDKMNLSGSELDSNSDYSSEEDDYFLATSIQSRAPQQASSEIQESFTDMEINQPVSEKSPLEMNQITIDMASDEEACSSRKRKRFG